MEKLLSSRRYILLFVILVFNDYLAKRDYLANEEIYRLCGLTSAYIDQHSSSAQRRTAYGFDVPTDDAIAGGGQNNSKLKILL